MARRILLLSGLAILAVVLNHAGGFGQIAMFLWADRYRPVSVPNWDQLGTPVHYALLTIRSVGVFAVPGIPMSVAYCEKCLEADSHPIGLLIANTVCCGGWDNCADWWKEIVEHSLEYQGKTLEWFNGAVQKILETPLIL